MATLRLVPVSGPSIDDVKDPSMVGRDPSCEIVVTDGSVSRRHARLERRAGAWWVVDQGSANGTYVNSLKIGEQALRNNQELRFGAMAFRVDLHEDPEATVATPFLADDSATVMAPATPPPVPPVPSPSTPRPAAPPPIPRAAAVPPPPPSAGAAKERFRPTGPVPPVPQMAGGAAPPKKGKSPFFWIALGCCGCLLLVAALAGVIGGGVFMATKGAADAAQAWLGHVRNNETEQVAAGMTEAYRSRPTAEEVEAVTTAIAQSKDATFPSRSVDNDRATLTGVLTGGPSPQPIVIRLVKEGGAWKVDDVTLGVK
jgi:predicted component of type VI protein secretion system